MIHRPMDVLGAPLEVEGLLFGSLRSFLLKHDWVTSYLIGNRRTARPDCRFYRLSNSLGCLFRLVLHNR